MNVFIFFILFLCSDSKYILFDVADVEGFNLRRDVYIRVINLVRLIKKEFDDLKVILPPLRNSYHWNTKNDTNWSDLFDLESLRKIIDVNDLKSFSESFNETEYSNFVNNAKLHSIVLKHHPNIENNDFTPSADEIKCDYDDTTDKIWNIFTVSKTTCMQIQMDISEFSGVVKEILYKEKDFDLYYFRNCEKLIHGIYSEWSDKYWTVRRSMIFNSKLIKIANKYRLDQFGSTDELDGTTRPSDWRLQGDNKGMVVRGGAYLSFHVRRRDFVWNRQDQFPYLEEVAQNISWYARKTGIYDIFVATDMPQFEQNQLTEHLSIPRMHFLTSDYTQNLHPAQIAVVDQIVASHARIFVGTFQSTFSFRIFEERQIIGFPTDTTYNFICPPRLYKKSNDDDQDWCGHASVWPVQYEQGQFTIDQSEQYAKMEL